MVTISCSGKLHAFALAEQMEKHGMLDAFYTSYASQKNTFWHRFVKRTDKEQVPVNKIHTNILLAFPMKLLPKNAYGWNNMFDHWVKGGVEKNKSKIFIGWSGMSLQSIRAAKKTGKIAIVERGSSHILCQNKILKEEYAKFGIDFSIDQRVIDKELKEYSEADYISIPSGFVRRSFIEYGVSPDKLLQNAYGTSDYFSKTSLDEVSPPGKFTIVYLGRLSVQKGLIYLFEALNNLGLPEDAYDVRFIGGIDEEMKASYDKWKRPNWIFHGHIDHYELPKLLKRCSVAVQPSLQEGMSMVIPQMLACGLPVIASENSGGEDIITGGSTGYIVPVRSPEAIGAALLELYHQPALLGQMKRAAALSVQNGLSWNDYGNRYAGYLKKIVQLS